MPASSEPRSPFLPGKGLLCALSGFAILLSGCLYTGHHFNTGRVLPPGQTTVTVGYGNYASSALACPDDYGGNDYWKPDSTGIRCFRSRAPDTAGGTDIEFTDPIISRSYVPKLSLGYRLGVREKWGPLSGVELGWHLEAFTNPGSAEFDLKLGLPTPPLSAFKHSLSAGWIVGAWTDNSQFLEYAASLALDNDIVYGNYRLTHLATQPEYLSRNWGRFISHPRWVHQFAFGYHRRLPKIRILPDFITPQAIFTYPAVANGMDWKGVGPFGSRQSGFMSDLPEALEWNLNFAVGWLFH